jgi:CTP synthase
MAKHVFVTGGVVSGLGKGITAASLGRLLKARGLKIAAQETRSLYECRPRNDESLPARGGVRHRGWVETDLDLGHIRTVHRLRI